MSVSVPVGVRDDETARKWLIGTALDLYRGEVKQTVLADLLGVTQSAISQYLRGVTPPEPRQILAMLDFLAVPLEKAQPLADFASWESGGRSWLAPFEKLIAKHNRVFIGCEGIASAIFRYAPLVIPAQLQVPGYTLAMTAPSMRVSKDQHQPRVELQQARQQRVLDGHVKLTVAIEEYALDRAPAGDRHAMNAQLEHLVRLDEQGLAKVRVLSPTVGYHEGLDGGRFAVASFENEAGVQMAGPLAFVELRNKAEYIVKPDEVEAQVEVQHALMHKVLSRGKSMDAIRKRLVA